MEPVLPVPDEHRDHRRYVDPDDPDQQRQLAFHCGQLGIERRCVPHQSLNRSALSSEYRTVCCIDR